MSSATTTRAGPGKAISSRRSATSRSTTAAPSPGTRSKRSPPCSAANSINKATGKLIRSDLILIDLCRYRDYADIVAAVGLNALGWLGFSLVTPAGLSA
jgi:hypothetical protein